MEHRPLLETARSYLPPTVARLIAPRFLIGCKPSFVGLHRFKMEVNFPRVAANGHSYDNCAHACYTTSIDDGVQTVVIPEPSAYHDPVGAVLHEIAHLFDEATGFHLDAPKTTPYSGENRTEAVAEAFAIILCPPSGLWADYVSSESMRPLRMAMGLA